MKKHLLTLAGIAAMMSASFAQAANKEAPRPQWREGGNGGDGVGSVEDGLVIRDLLDKSNWIVDNESYLREVPGLVDLLKDIAQGSPELAMSVWDDLKSLRIRTTNEKLPIIPGTSSELTGVEPDVQIAIRNGEDLLISIPAYEATTRKDLLMLHESFHGLLWGSGPEHHDQVRFLTRTIHQNRGHFNAAWMDKVIAKFNLRIKSEYEQSSALITQVRRALMTGEGSLEARCSIMALKSFSNDHFSGMGTLMHAQNELGSTLTFFSQWDDLASCDVKDPYALFAKEEPELFAYVSVPRAALIFGKPYQLSLSARSGKKFNRSMCEQWAGREAFERLAKQEELVQNAQRALAEAKTKTNAKGGDLSMQAYLNVMITLDPGPRQADALGGYLKLSDIDSQLRELRSGEQILDLNVENCRPYMRR